jgi:hypothetical protein
LTFATYNPATEDVIGGVVADAPQPPATGCDASGIVAIKKCH